MAVNLDKDAYYRRIKRLYSNWKVSRAAGLRLNVAADLNPEGGPGWRG